MAYPAFNTQNLETTLGIIQASEESNAPVIIATSEGTIAYAGLEVMAALVRAAARSSKAMVVLHFDHGKDRRLLERAIELGYSSIMLDHSQLPFEQNVRDTQRMVQWAHERSAWVQGEIGRMRGTEDWVSVSEAQTLLTEPDEAFRFWQATGVDSLACAVGTVHGAIKMSAVQPQVDLPRIRAIHQRVEVPLVLHGASGVGPQIIREAIVSGISIINIDTELRMAFTGALRKSLANNLREIDPRRLLQPAIAAIKETALVKIRQFGGSCRNAA